MNKLLLVLFLFGACCLVNTEKVLVCYYGTWAVYRSGLGKFAVDNVNTDLCTHVVYTFTGILSNGTMESLDPYLDLDYGNGNFRKFTNLKQKNPSLKTILAVGGWNEGSANYSIMASNETYRQNFIHTALDFILEYNFDGLDLDWEYPNQRDTVYGTEDIENFTQLTKELREEFDKYNLTVSAAVAAVEKSASQSYNVSAICQYLDYVHVMAYDMYGAWDNVTGHNAPLHKGEGDTGPREDLFTVDVAVEYWLSEGCPPEKLVLGMPLYGRSFTLVNASDNGVRAPASGAGIAGPYTVTNGNLGYNELCVILQNGTWDIRNDSLAEVPYAVEGINWVSYDDAYSLTKKVEFANSLNLAGAMVWSIETDDFHGTCGGGDFPLLRAINKALGRDVDDTDITEEPSTTEGLVTSEADVTTQEPTTAASTTEGLEEVGNNKILVCYYGTWATDRELFGKFDVEDINPNLCNHLIYAFAGIDSNGTVMSLDPELDLDSGAGNFRKFTNLKQKNPKLKTILAVGGWNEGSANYSLMASTAENRQTFIHTALFLIRWYNFDGIDIDWEYPNQRDTVYGTEDIENFTLLLKELREEFDKFGLLVSAAVAAVRDSASKSYDIPAISKYLDFVHVMTYDLHGAWDDVTGHNAALHRGEGDLGPREDLYTVDVAVEYWLSEGCPPEKLVMGMPLYGRTFTLVNASENGVKAPASGAGIAGPYTQEAGIIGYNEFCDTLQNETWDVRYDSMAKVPYAVRDVNWVTYDDVNSLTKKVEYANSLNLAGVMVWSIETDDFLNICGGGEFPLLTAITRALERNDTETTEEPATTYPSTAVPTTEVSTTEAYIDESSTTEDPDTFICQEEGFTANPKDCSSFYICVKDIYGGLEARKFQCPETTYWDQSTLTCNFQTLVPCHVA